jgi:outer membrane lipoprotein-sorting protein
MGPSRGRGRIGQSRPANFALAGLLGAVLCAAGPAAAQSLDAVYARLDKSAQQFHSFSADIRRNVHTAIVNDDSRENGTIKVRRDKSGLTHMLIDFTGADSKTVLFDSTTVSIYYPKIKTVQVYNVGDKRGLIDQFLLLGFGVAAAELRAAYDVTWVGTETIDGKPASHIQLVPKSKDVLMRLKKADLWLSDSNGMPVQQRFVTSASGDFMLVTYANAKLNPVLTEFAFKPSWPKGVQIEHPRL